MPSGPVGTGMPELGVTLLKSFGMLCVVIGLLFAVMWLLRRVYLRSGGGQPGLIQILASVYVAPKERIVLVDVLGEKLLLGITSQQITLLATLADEKGVCGVGNPEGSFKALLRRKFESKKTSGEKQSNGPITE